MAGHCLHLWARTRPFRSLLRFQLLFEHGRGELGVGLAPGGLHHLSHQEAKRRLLAAQVVRHGPGVVVDGLRHRGLDGVGVADLYQPGRFRNLRRGAAAFRTSPRTPSSPCSSSGGRLRTIPMRSDSCFGSMGTSSSDFPVALSRRVISLSIQLPAALARAASVPFVPRPVATTDSKKSAVPREAVNSEES